MTQPLENTPEANEPFVALVIYPTTREAQARQAATLTQALLDWMRGVAGLIRTQVFASEDGESIVTLAQWKDRESFERFRSDDRGQAAVGLAVAAHPKAFWLRVCGDSARPGLSATTPGA